MKLINIVLYYCQDCGIAYDNNPGYTICKDCWEKLFCREDDDSIIKKFAKVLKIID